MTFFCPFCQTLDPAHPPTREQAVTQTPYTGTVLMLEEARDFVLKVGLAEVVYTPKGKLPTRWDALAFTANGPDAWGEKLAQVWALRQQLAMTYPDQIFMGKIRGGRVVLMSIERLKQRHRQRVSESARAILLPQQADSLFRDIYAAHHSVPGRSDA